MGGRSYTEIPSNFSNWVDLGAEWIHGVTGNPITELAKKYNATTVETDYENLLTYFDNGTEAPSPSYDEYLENMYMDLMKEINYCNNEDKDVSLESGVLKAFHSLGFDEHQQYEMRFKLEDEITLDYAAPLSNLSCWNWDMDDNLQGPDYFFADKGYKQVIDGLASELPEGSIFLNKRVQRIVQTNDTVEVH